MTHPSRRQFLGAAAVTGAGFAIGKPGPSANGKINVAVIGAAGMGGYAVGQAARENFIAMCDVDDARAAGNFKKHPDVPRFKDFRVMLDKLGKQIDAVAISTPDHTHFSAAMAAMERGKHVFIQNTHPRKARVVDHQCSGSALPHRVHRRAMIAPAHQVGGDL